MWEKTVVISTIIYSQTIPYIWDWIKEQKVHFLFPFDIDLKYYYFILFFYFIQKLLYSFLISKKVKGPETERGNVPVYKNNGLKAWFLTFVFFFFFKNHISIYDLFVFCKALNYVGITLCISLFLNSRIFKLKDLNEPKFTGSYLLDFYKGVELHPKTDTNEEMKILINSRFGMMFWGVIAELFFFKAENRFSLKICALLQLIYITKFFIWEMDYVKTIDIAYDRCGYYLFWGCICYLPVFYSTPLIYHYYYSSEKETLLHYIYFILGFLCICLNWIADTLKRKLRNYLLNFENPIYQNQKVKGIRVVYKDSKGEIKQNWLVTSHLFSSTRYPNYFFEISASWFWCCSGENIKNIFPLLYFIYITVLLVHRTYRDDIKCEKKYKDGWKEYKNRVKYKIIPYIF